MKKAAWMLFRVLALALSVMALPGVAQDKYPSSPIRLVVAYSPGAMTDVTARLLAEKLSTRMNTTILVENKPGANGNIGTEFVAKSRPDGYTLVYNTIGPILSVAVGLKLGYDLFKDLAPVALVASSAHALYVHPSVPANTVAEFVAHLRANPGKHAYGSAGVGSLNHLGSLLFLQANGLTALHVPYKGSGAALIDLVSGRVTFMMQSVTAHLVSQVKDKRLKALAIASLKRSPSLPDVPTLNETVMPGFEVGNWFGVLVPAKTPPAIVKRLNGEIVKALQDPDMKSRLAQQNAEPLGSTPEEYGAYLRRELERWTKVIQSAGIKLE